MPTFPSASVPVFVAASDAVSLPRAGQIALTLELPFSGLQPERRLPDDCWCLRVSMAGLSLQQGGTDAPGPVQVDFVGGKMGFRRQRQEATPDLIKAVGVKSGVRPSVWDMTAGLGSDGFNLARYGCKVTLFERHPLVFALLSDGIERAQRAADAGDSALAEVLQRLSLIQANSIEVLEKAQRAGAQAQVIYIDTMFPERGKSAKVKKGMQVFQKLVGEDPDADRLLKLALACEPCRVVVKRPRHAPALSDVEANLTFAGKSIRYDVYALRRLEALNKQLT